MLVNQVIYDAKTGETRIEQVEVETPEILEEVIPTPTLEEKVRELEEVIATQDELINISLRATDEMFMMLEPLLDAVLHEKEVK